MKATPVLLVGIALTGVAATSLAANPDRARAHEAGAAIANNANAAPTRQPKTMAQSDATAFKTKSGGTAVRVASDLWSTLHVQPDAQQRMQVIEAEGDKQPVTAEGLPNE